MVDVPTGGDATTDHILRWSGIQPKRHGCRAGGKWRRLSQRRHFAGISIMRHIIIYTINLQTIDWDKDLYWATEKPRIWAKVDLSHLQRCLLAISACRLLKSLQISIMSIGQTTVLSLRQAKEQTLTTIARKVSLICSYYHFLLDCGSQVSMDLSCRWQIFWQWFPLPHRSPNFWSS